MICFIFMFFYLIKCIQCISIPLKYPKICMGYFNGIEICCMHFRKQKIIHLVGLPPSLVYPGVLYNN